MPGAGVKRAIEVRDEIVLGQVEFDLAVQLGEGEQPEVFRSDRGDGSGRRLNGSVTLLLPPGRVEVLGVDAVLVGRA